MKKSGLRRSPLFALFRAAARCSSAMPPAPQFREHFSASMASTTIRAYRASRSSATSIT